MTYRELINRLEAGSEADPNIDAEIWCEIFAPDVVAIDHNMEFPLYTASIDAALALVEKVLPEANCYGFDKSPSGVDAFISRNNVNEGHWLVEASASSAPRAILVALLRAKETGEHESHS